MSARTILNEKAPLSNRKAEQNPHIYCVG